MQDPNKDLDAQTFHNYSPKQRTLWTGRKKKTSKTAEKPAKSIVHNLVDENR